jgi:hypothetical protein
VPPGDAPPAAPAPTECICIDQMVSVEVFTSEEEYQARPPARLRPDRPA